MPVYSPREEEFCSRCCHSRKRFIVVGQLICRRPVRIDERDSVRYVSKPLNVPCKEVRWGKTCPYYGEYVYTGVYD